MDFKEKYNLCVDAYDSIDNPKYLSNDINSRADFLEIMALLAEQDGIAYGDILDRLYGESDEDQTAETHDAVEKHIDRIFVLFEERMSLFGDLYPFRMTSSKEIKLKENLSDLHKLYVFLLLSSSLNIFGAFQTELTTDFEKICFYVMKAFLPNAVVKEFGKHSEFQGTASEKIKALAKEIGLPIDEYEISQIGERNVQERGLDVIAWIPLNDACSNILVFLGQCACGKNYESKQHDTRRFENYYIFYKTKPQHTLFIPYSLINPRERKFYHSDYIESDSLIFERKRILTLLSTYSSNFIQQLDSKHIIEKLCGTPD